MLRVGTIKISAGSVSSYQRAERWDEPRFLSVHVSLMKSWLSCAPASTSPEYIYFTPKRLLLLRAGGGSWWSYRTAHPFWLYSCWRSSFWPPLLLNVVRCLFTKVPFLLSDSAGKTAKLFGKVKLNIPQPLLGLFSPGNLYLKEAVSYSLTLLVNVCYSVFVSTTFLTHIYANS